MLCEVPISYVLSTTGVVASCQDTEMGSQTNSLGHINWSPRFEFGHHVVALLQRPGRRSRHPDP